MKIFKFVKQTLQPSTMIVQIFIKDKRNTTLKVADLQNELKRTFKRSKVIIDTPKPKDGQMGLGFSSVINLVFDKDKIDKVVEFFKNYMTHKRVNLVLKNAMGEELHLNASLDRDQIATLLNGFFQRELLESPNKKTTKRRKK